MTNPEMTPTCIEACIICDIDGFTGTHDSDILGELPDDFCTFFTHNAQWIAFQAGSVDLQIQLSVSNCDIGDGLEMAIYESFDCGQFTLVSNCAGGFGAVDEGDTEIFTTTQALIIGQYYYLVMDGNRGDNCDWTLNVLQGSTQLDPLSSTNPIQGALESCPGSVENYYTNPELGAINFDWTLNGSLISTGSNSSIDVFFSQNGIYELCVTASNVCYTATPDCISIAIEEKAPFMLSDSLCQDDCYNIDGMIFCDPGNYEYTLTLPSGCDSFIVLELIELPSVRDSFDIEICEGDSIQIGNTQYYISGNYIDTLKSNTGCDSIVNINLSVIDSLMEFDSILVNEYYCLGTDYTFEIPEIQNIDTFIWTLNSEVISDSASVNLLFDSIGIYDLCVITANECDTTQINCNPINVIDIPLTEINEIICSDDCFEIDEMLFCEEGIHSYSLPSSKFCDSIIIINLVEIKTTIDSLNIQLCEGDQFIVGDTSYTQSGSYIDTLKNINGCDSLIHLNITLRDTLDQLSSIVGETFVCLNTNNTFSISELDVAAFYEWTLDDQIISDSTSAIINLTEGGLFEICIRAINQCDSTDQNCIIIQSIEIEDTFLSGSYCENTCFEMDGFEFCTPGVHHYTIPSFLNCDSNITIELLENPIVLDSIITNLCQGESIFIGSQNYTQTGTYQDTLLSSNDCDSIVYLNLTVNDTLGELNEIIGDINICSNTNYSYGVDAIAYAEWFQWTLNGHSISDSNWIDIKLDSVGSYELCVKAFNECDTTINNCILLNLIEIPETYITASFCEGECFEIDGINFCTTGVHQYCIPGEFNCDSNIILNLTEINNSSFSISTYICDGESFQIGNSTYTDSGNYIDTLYNMEKCDSIVSLALDVINCNIEFEMQASPLSCNGNPNGSFFIVVNNGEAPFTYNWNNLDQTLSGNGTILNLSDTLFVDNLPAGTFELFIMDNYGNSEIINISIPEPPPLSINADLSNYNDFNISCYGLNDGSIEIEIEGGTGFYNTQWSNGSNLIELNNLTAGQYNLSLTDSNGCSLEQEYILTEPMALNAVVAFNNLDCIDSNSGSISLGDISGGVAPYSYYLNGQEFTYETNIEDLTAGYYEISIVDLNNCEITFEDTLYKPDVAKLQSQSLYQTPLGCEIQIDLGLNIENYESISWAPSNFLSCDDCLNPTALVDHNTDFLVTVLSVDGCISEFVISIEVFNDFELYTPDIFSPNNDGSNDYFFIGASKSVESLDLIIYDRWGNKIFENLNSKTNDPLSGWNGNINNLPAELGVYIWTAKIYFIDNTTILKSGNFTLIR